MTRLVDTVKDAIIVQSGKVQLKLEMPPLEHGIVPFINQFGQLYYGQLTASEFENIYNIKKSRCIFDLLIADQLNEGRQQALGFWLYLCRVAQSQSWIWPGLMNRNSKEMHMVTGNSRMIATGLCKPSPHQHLSFLVLEDVDINPDYLDNPEKITTDEQLHRAFGYDPELKDYEDALARIQTRLIVDNNRPRLKFQTLDDGQRYEHWESGSTELENFTKWNKYYGLHPVLTVYTDYPGMITDSSKFWTIRYANPNTMPSHTMTLPGHLENYVRNLHNDHRADEGHSLFVRSPRMIDVSEFAFWIDCEHTTFLDTNYQFALYRKDSEFKTTTVTLSEIPYTPGTPSISYRS